MSKTKRIFDTEILKMLLVIKRQRPLSLRVKKEAMFSTDRSFTVTVIRL